MTTATAPVAKARRERMTKAERAGWQLAEDDVTEALRAQDRYMVDHPEDAAGLRDALSSLMAGWGEAWTDNLRPSEIAAQDRLAGEAVDEAFALCMTVARDAAGKAAIRFAREYPDAPRAER